MKLKLKSHLSKNKNQFAAQLQRINKFILLLSLFFLAACQTAPKDYSKISEGQWQAKVLVQDKVKSKSHILNIKMNAVNGKKLRMDITTPAGLHIASLAMNGKKLEYAMIRQKRFYKGKATSNALKPIITVPLHPEVFYSILFDTMITKKAWTCSKNSKGYLSDCESLKAGTKISWTGRNAKKKTVKITHAKADIQMNFNEFNPSLDKKNNLFSIKAPKSFSKFKLK